MLRANLRSGLKRVFGSERNSVDASEICPGLLIGTIKCLLGLDLLRRCGGSFGSAAVAIEAKHHKMTRRQLKIERKEIASQQINREDGATALEYIQTGTISMST